MRQQISRARMYTITRRLQPRRLFVLSLLLTLRLINYLVMTMASKARAFYRSVAWQWVRKYVLWRDHFECQHCKAKGRYRKAQCVHHVKSRETHPKLALTAANLVSLCFACHNAAHPEKLRSTKQVKRRAVAPEKW